MLGNCSMMSLTLSLDDTCSQPDSRAPCNAITGFVKLLPQDGENIPVPQRRALHGHPQPSPHAHADPSFAVLSSTLKYCGKHRRVGVSTRRDVPYELSEFYISLLLFGESCYLTPAGLKVTILLPQPP